MQAEYFRAYERGQELRGEDYEYIVRRHLVPDSYLMDDVLNLFFEAGYYGHPLPVYVLGWRYGAIPKEGWSYNYRDGYREAGISMMEVTLPSGDVLGSQDPVSAVFVAAGRKKVSCSGWLHFRRGSDGEPIIVGAKPAKK